MKGWMKSLCPQPTAWTETEKTYPHPKERTGPYRLYCLSKDYFTLTFTLCVPLAVRAFTTYIPAGRLGATSDTPL